MKAKKLLIVVLTAILTFSFAAARAPRAEALSAYRTYTLDRNGRLVTTNEAYEAVGMIRQLSDGTTLSGAKDLFIDAGGYLYVADTGNRRIVVLDPDYQVVCSFGSDLLVKPLGVYVRDGLVYIADYGLGAQATDLGAIHVYAFDKDTATATLAASLSTPESALLEVDGFIFRPMKIAVDSDHTMYIVNEGTTSGVLMVNADNHFVNYFASNSVEISFWDRIQRIVYQNNENVTLTKNIPTPVANVTLDGKGYFYTVTQTAISDSATGSNLKKVSIGGTNYFPTDMYVYRDVVDAATGAVGNVYAVTSRGFLMEYDNRGNLLFQWGGEGTANDKLGLFLSASAVAVDPDGNVLVVDDHASRNSIQIFRETGFASKVHEALDLYNQARYVESIGVWTDVLRYNSMFDMAYEGIGLGYMMNEQYDLALENFEIAYDKADYSEAYWEIRNLWMTEHFGTLLIATATVLAVAFAAAWADRRFRILSPVRKAVASLGGIPLLRETAYMFRFIRHPADACYEVKAKKKVSVATAFFVLALLFGLYVVSMVSTGFVFNGFVIEETILVNEALAIVLPILVFVFANYLMSSLMEGEGTLKATFVNTIGALMPVFLVFPFAILVSNAITLNESFLYTFSIAGMLLWSGVLLFFNIKETHNYSVGQTVVNLFLTVLMMVVLIVVMIMVYLMVLQVANFVGDVVKELILRD
ncbi:MAG: YIP1 family protein [Candidatus Izemoplasmatales bacterium]